ncbi:YveK family protein [Patescibacteria group bacterium]
MNLTPLQSTLRKYMKDAWIIPVLACLAAGAVILTLALVKTPEYSSEFQVLVVQRYTLTDSYTAVKSAEKVSQNLADVISTSTFLDQVLAYGGVDLSELQQLDEAEKRETWEQMVEADVVSQTAMLKVTAYDEDPAEAEKLANAVGNVLLEHGSEYHGAPDTISLKIVDKALTSDRPTRPNLLLNGLAAGLFGAILGLLVVLLRPSIGLDGNKPKGQGDHEYTDPNSVAAAAVEQGEKDPANPYSVLEVTNYDKQLDGRSELILSGPSAKSDKTSTYIL